MSTMIVKVRAVEQILRHPNADRLEVAVVGGWKTIIQKGQFKPSDKCVFFPPDSILPEVLANGPEDTPAGRLNVAKYCGMVKDASGNLTGYRVKAARLRGQPSYGLIMSIDASRGDQNWDLDTDVADIFGVTKWEPPLICEDGDAASGHRSFEKYTEIEHLSNFPTAIADGEEVVITEKIHGKNTRMGAVVMEDENGNPTWDYMAGSHDVPRKQLYSKTVRMDAVDLCGRQYITKPKVEVGEIFQKEDKFFRVDELRYDDESWWDKLLFWLHIRTPERRLFRATEVTQEGAEVLYTSEYWMFLKDGVMELIDHLRDEYVFTEDKKSVVVYGEIYGSGVQSMVYGFKNGQRGFRLFDIAINGEYLDYDVKAELCKKFGVEMVPFLYRGPFSREVVEKFTDGKTTLCDPKDAGAFAGREGCVTTPVKERYSDVLNGRCIVKSVSADYLAAKDMSDNKN